MISDDEIYTQTEQQKHRLNDTGSQHQKNRSFDDSYSSSVYSSSNQNSNHDIAMQNTVLEGDKQSEITDMEAGPKELNLKE